MRLQLTRLFTVFTKQYMRIMNKGVSSWYKDNLMTIPDVLSYFAKANIFFTQLL